MAGKNRSSLRADGSDQSYLGGLNHNFLESDNGQYRAGIYANIFGVIRRENGRWVDEMEIWGTPPGRSMDKVWAQTDGNLVAYDSNQQPLAESDTNNGVVLRMQDDGDLILFAADGDPRWSSRSGTSEAGGFFVDAGHAVVSVYDLAKEIPGVSLLVSPVEAVASFGGSIVNGDNVLDAAKGAYGALKDGVTDFASSPLSQVAVSYVANVPGFGTVAGAGLSALIAVAQGKSLTDVGLAAIKGALPGQPLSGQLFDAGLALAKGENVLKTTLSFGLSQGGAYLSSAVSNYSTQILGQVTSGVALPKFELPGGASLPVGLKDIVNLGATAYNQLREKVPGDARAKSAFDLAVQLSAASPDPQIVENTRQSLQGDQKQAFELGMALHAGVTVGKVAMATGTPQPALSKAVTTLEKRTTARKAAPLVAGFGALAVAAVLVL